MQLETPGKHADFNFEIFDASFGFRAFPRTELLRKVLSLSMTKTIDLTMHLPLVHYFAMAISHHLGGLLCYKCSTSRKSDLSLDPFSSRFLRQEFAVGQLRPVSLSWHGPPWCLRGQRPLPCLLNGSYLLDIHTPMNLHINFRGRQFTI